MLALVQEHATVGILAGFAVSERQWFSVLSDVFAQLSRLYVSTKKDLCKLVETFLKSGLSRFQVSTSGFS